MNAKLIARSVVSGLAGKLDFEFSCKRGWVFSEVFIHSTVAEIIGSRVASSMRVASGVSLGELNAIGSKSGRKREVDLAVVETAGGEYTEDDIRAVLEVKWASRRDGYASDESILRDILRLSLIAQERPQVPCLFVLAGGRSPVEQILGTGALAPIVASGKSLLPSTDRAGAQVEFPIKDFVKRGVWDHGKKIGAFEERYGIVPNRVVLSSYSNHACGSSDWDVRVWRVWPYSASSTTR